MGMKRTVTLWGLLFVPIFFFAQQGGSVLTPYKITIFQDAVQVGQKGIVRFHQQKAEVPMELAVDPSNVDLIANGEFDVAWYRFRMDTTVEKGEVRSWTDVLKANISRRVTILYEIGSDYDEVRGDVRWVNEKDQLMLLRGDDGNEYFIPLHEVRQVIIETLSDYRINQKVARPLLEIKLANDAPFVPLEMFSLHEGINWEPVCRIRIVSSEKAVLEMNAMVENRLHDFEEIEVEISPGSITKEGQMSGDVLELGKVALKKGDKILVNFRKVDLKYDASFQARVPWVGLTTNTRRDYPVKSLMRFTVPVSNSFSCDRHAVIDENNRNIANIGFSEAGSDGKVVLDLGAESGIKVNCVEVEKKRSGKAIKLADGSYTKVSVEGKLIVYNVTTKFARMDLIREVKGEVTGNAGGKVEPVADSQDLKTISWEVNVDAGGKQEIRYKYDTYIPYEK